MNNVAKKIKEFLKKTILNRKTKLGIFSGIIVSFSIFIKAKALAPLAAWGIKIGATALIGALVVPSIGKWVISTATKGIIALVQLIVGQIVALEINLLSWVISMQNFTTLPIVRLGWRITRDFSNILFIAVLIYLAFAIILRIQNYNASSMLWKVIVMAVLINFSLMIGGVIIDVSQVFFFYFLRAPFGDKVEYNPANTGLAIGNQLGLHQILGKDQSLSGSTGGEGESKENRELGLVGRAIFVIIFSFVYALVLGGLVLILFVRNFYLWILLIFAPIAWVVWVIPIKQISGFFNQWWSEFMKWVFVAPIIAFFIFLSLYTTEVIDDFGKESTNKILVDNFYDDEKAAEKTEHSSLFFGRAQTNIFGLGNLSKSLITVIFLLFSMKAAQSMGVRVAGSTLSFADRIRRRATDYAWGKVKSTAKDTGRKVAQTGTGLLAAGTGAVTRALPEGLRNRIGRYVGDMSKVPLIGAPFKAMTRGIEKLSAGAPKMRESLVKQGEKRIENMSKDQIKRKLELGQFDRYEKIAAQRKIGVANEKHFKDLQGIYKSNNMQDDLANLKKENPYWTDEFKGLAKGYDDIKKNKLDTKSGSELAKKQISDEERAIMVGKKMSEQDILAESYKRALANQFKGFDADKMAINFEKDEAFKNPDSISNQALAVVASKQRYGRFADKVIDKMSPSQAGKLMENVVKELGGGKINERGISAADKLGYGSLGKDKPKGGDFSPGLVLTESTLRDIAKNFGVKSPEPQPEDRGSQYQEEYKEAEQPFQPPPVQTPTPPPTGGHTPTPTPSPEQQMPTPPSPEELKKIEFDNVAERTANQGKIINKDLLYKLMDKGVTASDIEDERLTRSDNSFNEWAKRMLEK